MTPAQRSPRRGRSDGRPQGAAQHLHSDLLVISWWSNCLGLVCLHRLAKHVHGRRIYLIQVGKGERQKSHFRYYMPPEVNELDYPSGRSARDWEVREFVVRSLLSDHPGLWFMDHDLFIREDCDDWLATMDRRFAESGTCLAVAEHPAGGAVTDPAFWISPRRLPVDTPSFAPVATDPRTGSREQVSDSQPTTPVIVSDGDGVGDETAHEVLVAPRKETLTVAAEALQERGLLETYPLSDPEESGCPVPTFPCHEHLGSVYMFWHEQVPAHLARWMKQCVARYAAFYRDCPPEWRSIEDPRLRTRLRAFGILEST